MSGAKPAPYALAVAVMDIAVARSEAPNVLYFGRLTKPKTAEGPPRADDGPR